jgi:hypothetical protein
VQQLGYHEFVELGRVAVRTMEQKKIIVNNLLIRRATEALSKSDDIDSVRRILRDAFYGNDFDGFELTLVPGPTAPVASEENARPLLTWRKSDDDEAYGEWALTIDLKLASGQELGSFSLCRRCNGSPLLVDINLLIAGFNTALSGALERVFCGTVSDPAYEEHSSSNEDLIGVMHDARAEA